MPQLQPARAPPYLPLDILYSIFEFYSLNPVGYESRHVKHGGRDHHTKVSRFGGVCRDWHRASMWQSCYAIHDTADSNARQRLRDLRQLLHYRGTSSVKEFCFETSFKAGTWVMADNPILSELIDTVPTTLTFLKVHLRLDWEDLEGGNQSANTDNMRLLFQSMSRVERLKELELSVLTPIPAGEHTLRFFRNAKALRHCDLYAALSANEPVDGESQSFDWRSFLGSVHSSTPWHQLTSLSVGCTNSSLPLIAIILTSGTITHLELGGYEDPNDPPSHSAFQNLFSAIEAYSTPIIDFAFSFCESPTEAADTPPLDHLLPFLTSCTHLHIYAAYLDSTNALSSMPKLKFLIITQTILDSHHPFHNVGLTVTDLTAFVWELKPRTLDVLSLTLEGDFAKDATSEDRDNLMRFKAVARLLDFDLYAYGEGGVEI